MIEAGWLVLTKAETLFDFVLRFIDLGNQLMDTVSRDFFCVAPFMLGGGRGNCFVKEQKKRENTPYFDRPTRSHIIFLGSTSRVGSVRVCFYIGMGMGMGRVEAKPKGGL